MTNRALVGLSILATAFLGSPVCGQNGPAGKKPGKQKVVIIGASVSAGFEDPTSRQADGTVNRSYRLDAVLKKVWPRPAMRAHNQANMMMFLAPTRQGRRQIEFAKKVQPDLLLGVDFPFWFGYGSVAAGAPGKVNERRLAVQQECFKLLDGMKCPIILGDYPDMRGASTKMLPRSMIPNEPTIAALNERLRAYAEKRPNVHVLSLARFVKDAVSRSQTYAYGDGKVVFPKNFLLQSDRLHATRLGMLVLTTHLLDALPRVLPKKHPLLGRRPGLAQLVDAFPGLEDELPQPAKQAAGGKKLP